MGNFPMLVPPYFCITHGDPCIELVRTSREDECEGTPFMLIVLHGIGPVAV
jgi:hypothetical protein